MSPLQAGSQGKVQEVVRVRLFGTFVGTGAACSAGRMLCPHQGPESAQANARRSEDGRGERTGGYQVKSRTARRACYDRAGTGAKVIQDHGAASSAAARDEAVTPLAAVSGTTYDRSMAAVCPALGNKTLACRGARAV